MNIKVQIDGLQQAMRDIETFGDGFKRQLAPAVKEGADIIRDAAKSRIRRKSIGGALSPGELSRGVVSQVTWNKNASKAFAGAGMDKAMNHRFVYHTKGGVRYYIPSAVEYGHRAPGGGGYVVMEIVKRGKRKGQFRAAASSKQNKSARPRSFMRWAYRKKKKEVEAVVTARLAAYVRRAAK